MEENSQQPVLSRQKPHSPLTSLETFQIIELFLQTKFILFLVVLSYTGNANTEREERA